MRHNKLFSAAIALCMIAFFTIGSVPSQAAPKKTPVTINSVYTYLIPGTLTFTGTFTINIGGGAFVTTGDATMVVDLNSHGNRAHCLYTFEADEGTLIIREECTFSTDPAQGRWEIVSGTGAFEGLRGNGSALMPGNQENWVGFIYNY